MNTPYMNAFAQGLAAAGFRVVRFEFPYMAARRATGKKQGPDRQPVLLDTWRTVIEACGAKGLDRLVIGGKSMGGRMASLVAADSGVAALVCLGYPFHPPGRPAKTRTEHLVSLETPTLVLQGTRDPFGRPDELGNYELSRAIEVRWIEDGDHDLKPRKSSGRTVEQNWQEGIEALAAFVAGL